MSARPMAPPKDILGLGLPAASGTGAGRRDSPPVCAHSNVLLCFLPRIDKTMLASLKIK